MKEQIESLDAQYEEILQALKDEDKKIWDAVKQERQDRIAADEAEAIAREEKDTELETAIADETETRINKDKELKDAIDFTKADLMSVIEACGLVYNEKLAEGRVSYTPDTHDEVIRDAKNVTEAIDKISKFAIKLGQDIKLSVANTDTVNLTIEENGKDGGNTLTAEVNIAGTEGLSKKNYDNNIIGKTAEGLYASVSVEPSASNPNILVFTTSGYIDGQFKVDAFETEVPLTVYKGDNGKNTGITVTVDADKNLISGELNLASDETNILKLEDGEYIVQVDMWSNCDRSIATSWAVLARYNKELLNNVVEGYGNPAIGEYPVGAGNGDHTTVMKFTINRSNRAKPAGQFVTWNSFKPYPIDDIASMKVEEESWR